VTGYRTVSFYRSATQPTELVLFLSLGPGYWIRSQIYWTIYVLRQINLFPEYHENPLTAFWKSRPKTDYRLRGSASPVLTATGFVNGKWQFSTPHRIDTPRPISKKFVTGYYVGDPLRLCQIRCISAHGGFWAHGWNITKIIFMPFFGNAPTSQTPRRICTHDGSNDADSRKDVPFGDFFTLLPI